MATEADPADKAKLMKSDGWKTLLTILETSGERPPKRPSPSDWSGDGDSDRLAKRVGGVRLD